MYFTCRPPVRSIPVHVEHEAALLVCAGASLCLVYTTAWTWRMYPLWLERWATGVYYWVYTTFFSFIVYLFVLECVKMAFIVYLFVLECVKMAFIVYLFVLECVKMEGNAWWILLHDLLHVNTVYHVPLFNYKFLLYSTRLIQTVRIKLTIFSFFWGSSLKI